MHSTPNSIVSYKALGLEESFQETYFGTIFSNLSLCVIDEKICKGFMLYVYYISKFEKMHKLVKNIWQM
jgi:hypothetical protein